MTLRNLIVLVLFPAILLAAQDTPDKTSEKVGRDSILFRNGDMLYGALQSIDRENGISWHRPDAIIPFTFSTEMVSQLEFAGLDRAMPSASSNLCQIQLVNGDEFQAGLIAYDGETLTVETWFGGTLQFPKNTVALIAPLGMPKPRLFAGPVGVEGWTMGKINVGALVDTGQWVYQDGAFFALKSASIARDLDLPDTASIQFKLEWRGFFHIAIALYTQHLHPINLANKETEPEFGGFYSLQLNPFSANLLPVKQHEPLRYLGQASLQALAQTNAANIDIRVSKSKKLIALLINGVLIRQWVDEDFAGSGTAVRFVHQGQGAVKLSDIRVTGWDGQFEEPISLTPNKSQDLARLKNGDRVIGTVQQIRDGKMTIQASNTTLDIPITRVKQVEIASDSPAIPKITPQTVRAFFNSGLGSLTFDLDKWTEEELGATSKNFGTATFKPDAFSRILFDLNDHSPAPSSRAP
mgnify:CR=1 FL=1